MILSDSQESHDRYMERFKVLLCLFIGKLEREPFVVGRRNLEGASCSVEGVHISPSLWQFEWGCYCSRYWLFFHFPPHLIYPEIKCCKHATWRTLPLSHCQGERGDGWTLSFRAAEGHTMRPVWRLRHVTWVEVDSRGKLCGSISSDRN